MHRGQRFGPYQLVSRIGRGGMGEVWEAVLHGPRGFERTVALKLLRASVELDDAARRALLAEARLGAMLAHPNVVAVHEAGEIEGRVYVAMEIVHGVPASRLIEDAVLSSAAIRAIGEQAARGLHHCHSLEIDGVPVRLVHRDVKPQNLLVDRYGTVRVVDLGIARLVGSGAQIAGTLGFMPPEQAAGVEDARADVFALGATLCTLAAREHPFGRLVVTAAELPRRLDPTVLARVDAVVPGLEAIVRKCLRADPAERYPTALDLAEALALLPFEGEPLAVAIGRVMGVGADTPPPPLPSDHLPSSEGPFVGRDAERSAIVGRIQGDDRLLTLLGPGGAGKTRLALEAAREVAPDLAGGAWFCDLSGVETVPDLCARVARTLQVPLSEGVPVSQIGRALRARGRILVVLDNFEQLVREAADVPRRWAETAPDATLLVTTRIALRLAEERVLTVGPLEEGDALALFRKRAPRITSSDEEIRGLVRQLDGLPLAIELAAARSRVMSVADLTARLDERFRILVVGDADRPARHQSLAASLESSWELLAPWEGQALAQLAVFVDGFALEAAAAVLDLRPWPEAPSTLVVLGSLYDQSLLRVDLDGRFRMLVSIREYASQRRSAHDRAADEGRHAAYFAQLGSPDALAAIEGHGSDERRRKLAAEVEDLIVAARTAAARGDGATTAGAALAAWAVLVDRGPAQVGLELLRLALGVSTTRREELRFQEGVALAMLYRTQEAREKLEALLVDLPDPRDARRIRVLLRLSFLEQQENRYDTARGHLTEAVELAVSVGDVRLEAHGRLGLGAVLHREGRSSEAVVLVREALALIRSCGDRRSEANTRNLLGLVLRDLGEIALARAELEEAARLGRGVGSSSAEARALGNLGLLAQAQHQLEEAERLYLAALALHRTVGEVRSEATTLGNLGTLYQLQGRSAEALTLLEASVAGHVEGGDRQLQGHAVENVGHVLRERGRTREALRRFERSAELYRSIGSVRSEIRALREAARCRRVLGDPRSVLRLERAVRLAVAAGRDEDAARCRAELVHARLAVGDRDRARAAVQDLADPYARALMRWASALLGGPDAELREAIALLEPLGEPVLLAGCLVALAGRSEAEAEAALDRAAVLLGDRVGPEAVALLRARADRARDRDEARRLRSAAQAMAVAIGAPIALR